MGILKPGQVFSRVEFEKRFKDPEVISSVKQPGDFVSQLLRIREYGQYVEKIPFGKLGEVCFRIVEIPNELAIQNWQSQREKEIFSGARDIGLIRHPQPGELFDVQEFESLISNREYIGEVKDGEWKMQIYHLPDFGVYAAKGASGRWDGDCYRICDFTNEKEARVWISSFS